MNNEQQKMLETTLKKILEDLDFAENEFFRGMQTFDISEYKYYDAHKALVSSKKNIKKLLTELED